VIEDHERIEELLAGYALLSLDGQDAAEADRLLAEHVPTCLVCRRAVAGFQELSGDLALIPAPVPVPDLLLPSLHRSIDQVPRRTRSYRGATMIAVAASVIALVAVGGVSLTMAGRVDDAETKSATALEMLTNAIGSSSEAVPLEGVGAASDDTSFVEVAAPDVRTIYLASDGCPEPRPGMAYQLWLGADGTYVPYSQFRPDGFGHVVLKVPVDISRFNEILITEEVAGVEPSAPNLDGERTWRAQLG
jgi:hypothetical protein